MRLSTVKGAALWIALAGTACGQPSPFAYGPPDQGGSPPVYGGSAARAAAGPIATRQTAFSIPFAVSQDNGAAAEVELYVSGDQGATWQLYARRPVAEGRFYFRAPADGVYWFASRTLYAGSAAAPAGSLQAELQVLVDTAEPQLDFDAVVGPAGDVKTSWKIVEPHLAADSFQLAYQPAPGQPWRNVAVSPPQASPTQSTVQGQTTWFPESTSRVVNIRCEIRDQAGNTAVANRRVFLPKIASRPETQSWAADNSPPPDPYALTTRTPAAAKAWPEESAELARAEPPAGPLASQPGRQPGPPPQRAAGPAPTSGVLADAAAYDPSAGEVQPHIANRFASASSENPPPASPPPTGLPPGETPRMTTSREFRLDYEVDSVGPGGVADVELWVTTDAGRSWTRWGVDPDRQSPLDVEVSQEGVYGFRIVIVASNGLAGRAPVAGDPADIWVGVDATKPTARFTSALYGVGEHAGKLDIRWEADDLQLADRPVSLAFSEQADGPWTTIASGLPNAGQYFWPIDQRVPREVYLRLEVVDLAGNVGQHQLNEPISIEGLTPQGRIRSLLPGEPAGRQAYRAAPVR